MRRQGLANWPSQNSVEFVDRVTLTGDDGAGVHVLVGVEGMPELVRYDFAVRTELVEQRAATPAQDLEVNPREAEGLERRCDGSSLEVRRAQRCRLFF